MVKKISIVIFTILVLFVLFIIILPDTKSEIKSKHFTFIYSKSIDTNRLLDLKNALENNYARISKDLETIPAANIEVNVYAQRWRYIKATGNWSASGSIEGISKLHFVERAWGESDGKKVAVHEFAHTVVLKLLIDREQKPLNSNQFDKKFSKFPVWLWESISVYEAGQFVDPKTLSFLNQGTYPNLSELNIRSKGGKIYSVGYTIIEYILKEYGQEKLIFLVENYGDVSTTFHTTEQQFSQGWYDFVKEKYLR
jgi:hypothetical protein